MLGRVGLKGGLEQACRCWASRWEENKRKGEGKSGPAEDSARVGV
jgi:hypothetical protein